MYYKNMIKEGNMEQQNKSALAKLLATENISFQHDPSAKTAYFDVKNRLLVLPVWQNISNDLYDMLVVHEVGHALDTPSEGWLDAIGNIAKKAYGKVEDKDLFDRMKGAVKGFLNVVEDARIDKRQKRRYPGSRRNYVIGYKELIDRDFFGTSTKDVNTMSFIDRANMYFKGGAMIGIKFDNADERRFIRLMENAETFEEVIDITEEIFLWSKQKAEEQSIKLEDFVLSENESEDEFDRFDEGDEGEEGDEEGNGPSVIARNSNDSDNTGKSGGMIHRFIPVSDTERAWNQSQEQIVMSSNMKYVYVDIPTARYENIVDDYKVVISDFRKSFAKLKTSNSVSRGYGWQSFDDAWYNAAMEELNKFKQDEMATISFMLKEFEMRKQADVYSRTSIAKTGIIDTNKLPTYMFNEDMFRRVATVAEGKNHGFVMILDWSGSMCTNLKNTMKQLFSLTMFCKRVQIPFEVYIFRDPAKNENINAEQFSRKDGEIILDKFKLRNILSSRMKLTELNEMYQLLWVNASGFLYETDGMGGTPLNAAIVAAEEVVKHFRKTTRVQIVNTVFLTDGESNGIYQAVNRPNIVGGFAGADRRQQVIVRDNVSKKEYKVKSHADNTNILLRILKDRTGVNLIGFFLHDGGYPYLARRYYGNLPEGFDKMWKNNNFIPVTSDGYDDYYIVNTTGMNLHKEEFKVDSNMSKRKLATAFSNFSKKKSVNRVLLQRFMEKITKEKKVA